MRGGAYVGALAHVYQDAPTLFVFTISAPGLILLVGGLIYMQVIMLQADAWAKGQRIAHRYRTRRNP